MSSLPFGLFGAVALAIIIFIYRQGYEYTAFLVKRRQTGCLRARKYPHSDPVFGYDLYRERRQARKEGSLIALYTRDFRRLGKTWEERFLNQNVINTMDARNHQYVHTVGFEEFGKPPTKSKISAPILGNGIFIAEGAHWKRSRTAIKPIFAKAEVGNMTMMAKHVDRFLSLLPDDSRTFDIEPMLKKLFLDLSTEFLFGESIEAQTPKGAPIAENFLQSLDESLRGWKKRRIASFFSIGYLFDRTWSRAYKRLYSFIDPHVHRALNLSTKSPSEKQPSPPTDPSRKYILLHELSKQIHDPIALRSELINVFLPSRDATASLVSNVLHQLTLHPKHWAELRQSAFSVPFDDDENPSSSSFSISTLNSLLPFRHIINETLRTLGPAGRMFRTARKNTTLPYGGGPDGNAPVFVAKGTMICSLTYHIHHDPDIWGDDADEFRPERWIQAKSRGCEFVPFLIGPRMCPAQQQVYVQATYVLFRMVRVFEGIENGGEVEGGVEQRMEIEGRGGTRIALRPAEVRMPS